MVKFIYKDLFINFKEDMKPINLLGKDFSVWHRAKTLIEKNERRPFFHEREIWFCRLGVNVGFEQDGKGEDFLRPVVIIRKFNQEIFWGVPLTKTNKILNAKTDKYYLVFRFITHVQSLAILSQIRLLDSKRLARRAGEMAAEDFKILKQKIKALLP